MNRTLRAVTHILYSGENAGGVPRPGWYNIDKGVFATAVEEYLRTGKEVLPEYDRLTYLSWNTGYPNRDGWVWGDNDVALYEKAINKETFWNIHYIYSEDELVELDEVYQRSKHYYQQLHSYKSRRKQLFTTTLKRDIKKRDKCRCRKCHTVFPESELIVHHKKRVIDGGDNSKGNLITLCRDCHKKVHSRRRRQ